MRVKTFVTKLSVEAVHDMDGTIGDWIERNGAVLKIVTQTVGEEKGHDGRQAESVLVTSIWYEPKSD